MQPLNFACQHGATKLPQHGAHAAILLLLMLLLSGCNPPKQETAWIPPTQVPSHTPSPMPSPTSTEPIPPPPTETPHPTPTQTATHLPTEIPTLSPSPTWELAGPGEVTVPILLYHHIGDRDPYSRYYVSPQVFEVQMRLLKEWGYQTITATELAAVILHGGRLPPRPIVITFDDGDQDVYENAFPVLQELGFVATMYVIADYLDQPNYLNVSQLKELAIAGWEIGSHSSNHYDLTLDYSLLYHELYVSRQNISNMVGVEVNTFAYPYGRIDPNVIAKTRDYGYLAGMGLGTSVLHSPYSIYYLSRQEVQSSYDLEGFTSLIPWKSPSGEP